MMWNTAHGHPFVYAVDKSYLNVHLSFTLGLMGYLFWIWDNPFLLMVLQWFSLVSGAGLLAVVAVRCQVPHGYTAGVLVFWTAYHFSQSTVLCEFHGVSLYFFFLPLLYMARRERWRAGYGYAALSLAYVLLAVFVLFPMVNGTSLVERRQAELGLIAGADLTQFWTHMGMRMRSLGWILLPIAPLLPWGWRPLLVIPSAALAITMLSTYPHQFDLRIHYPAVITACVGVAMVEVGRRLSATGSTRRARATCAAFPLYALMIVLLSHAQNGFLVGSRAARWKRSYQRVNADGRRAWRIAREQVPKEGVLLTTHKLAGFVANRPDYLQQPMGQQPVLRPNAEVVFCRMSGIPLECLAGLRDKSWGVRYFDDRYVVLQRGYATNLNAGCLRQLGG